MSFQEDLAEKVAEIERLAKEMWGDRLRAQGLMVGEDGTLVDHPDMPAPMHPVDVDQEELLYRGLLSYVDQVKNRFELYYYLDTNEMVDLAAKIVGLKDSFSDGTPYTAFDRIDHADDEWMRPVLEMIDAEEWSGPAARTFYDDFLMAFHDAAERQMACTRVLGMAAMAAYKGVIAAQDDLLAIADASIEAFRPGGETNISMTLNVTSILAGVAGLFLLTAPPVAGATAGVISVGTGIASMFAGTPDTPDKEWEVSGVNPPQILESIWESLMKFEEGIAEQDRQMGESLGQDVDSPSCFGSAGLRLPDPNIDGGFGQHEVGTVVPGVPLSENEVVVTVIALQEAGSRNLPSAAYQYEQAASQLSDTMPASFSRLFPRTASSFQEARARVRGAVSDISWDLKNAGEDLLAVARTYPTTDEQNAEILRQIEMILPPVLEEPNYPPYY
jgi:hypothetical protein